MSRPLKVLTNTRLEYYSAVFGAGMVSILLPSRQHFWYNDAWKKGD